MDDFNNIPRLDPSYRFVDLEVKTRPSHSRVYKWLLWIFLIGIGTAVVVSHYSQELKSEALISPLANSPVILGLFASPTPTPSQGLQKIVEKNLEDASGEYGVFIKNLKTGEQYGKGEKNIFETGSLYKLWVMAETYQKIEAGDLREDQVLSQSVEKLNKEFSIDPEDAEQTEGTVTFTVGEALNQMITISHNYAALLLTEKIKLSSVAAFLNKYGFEDSSVGTHGEAPVTTASDIGLFFEKLYQGELGSSESIQEMLTLLKNQRLNSKIPKYVPKDIKIAHKTGELGEYSHDAGIIYSPGEEYILVVLTKSEDPATAEEKISELSKQIYQYFNSN